VIAQYGVGGGYNPLASPARILDTRHDGPSGNVHDPIPPNTVYEAGLQFDGVSSFDVTALAVTLTATNVTKGGYLTAYNEPTNLGAVSTLNLIPGATVANLAIVPSVVDSGYATMEVYNGSSAPVDTIVDVVGFYTDSTVDGALRFHSLATPTRIVDTRLSKGTTKLAGASTHVVTVGSSVADRDTVALAANATAIKPSSSTYLTFWPDLGLGRPTASNLNAPRGAIVATAALIGLGDDEAFDVYSSATTDLVVDVAGTFDVFPATGASALRVDGSHAGAVQSGSHSVLRTLPPTQRSVQHH
jgi:hypothetical protein